MNRVYTDKASARRLCQVIMMRFFGCPPVVNPMGSTT